MIAEAPSGANGFGYDPIFFYPPLGRTFADLSREEKSRVSHRGQALAELQRGVREGDDLAPAPHAAERPLGAGRMTEPVLDLVRRTRSIRRFHQDRPVELATLRGLIDLARLSASGGNRQPLKYILSCAPAVNARIFACVRWAAHLQGWPGPAEGERPAAYIVVLADTAIRSDCDTDLGIAAQSILLGAAAAGLGGCMLVPADRARARAASCSRRPGWRSCS